jgi:hypothetical protein
VVFGRSYEEVAVPYQAIVEAIRPLLTQVSVGGPEGLQLGNELSRIVPDLRRQFPMLSPATDADPAFERLLLFDSVRELLSVASAKRPVLVVLDDLHWADPPTLLLLRHVLRSPEPMAVMVLGTYRGAEAAQNEEISNLLLDLNREHCVDRVALGGLAAEVVRRLVEALGGADLAIDPTVSEVVATKTGGNPLFIKELVLEIIERGVVDLAALPLPQGVREVVSQRVARLGLAASEALSVAAVVGHNFDVSILGEVLATSEGRALDAVEIAMGAGLVVEHGPEFAFAHALIRQTVYQDMGSAARVRFHARVAEALERRAERAPGPLAFHFAMAAVDGRSQKAAEYAIVAGREAIDRLAFEEGVAVCRRGLSALDAGGFFSRSLRCELRLVLAEALRGAGDVAASVQTAQDASDDARAVGSPKLFARAAVLNAEAQFNVRGDESKPALILEALEQLGADDPALRTLLLIRLSGHRAFVSHDPDDAARLATEALNSARALGDRRLVCEALTAAAQSLLGTAGLDQRLAYLDEAVELGQVPQCLAMRANSRLIRRDLRGFDDDVALLQRMGTERRSWFVDGWARLLTALRRCIDGEFLEASALLDDVTEQGIDHDGIRAASTGLRYLLGREMGQQSDLLPFLESAVGATPVVVAFRVALALTRAEVGQLEAAASLIATLAPDGFALLPRDYSLSVSLSLLAEASALIGEAAGGWIDPLRARLGEFEGQLAAGGWGAFCGGAIDRYIAILDTAGGRWEEAEAGYRAALDIETPISEALTARTRAWYGRMLSLRAPSDPAAAATQLSHAADIAARLHMVSLAEQVERWAGEVTRG